jgi:hypothetical protein
MRSFVQSNFFDAAVNFCTSFGYFDDPLDYLRVLQNLAASVKSGGGLRIEANGKEVIARTFRERTWRRNDDGTFLLEEIRISDGWRTIETKWILTGRKTSKEFTLCVRPYSAAEIIALLKEGGFSEVRAFGDILGAPYDSGAKRLVVVARK